MASRRRRGSKRPPATQRPVSGAADKPPAPKRTRPSIKQTQPRLRVAAIGLGLAGTLAVFAFVLFGWSFVSGPGQGKLQRFEVRPSESLEALTTRLVEAGLVGSPRLFRAYVTWLNPGVQLVAGAHWVRDDLAGRELLKRLARVPGRSSAHVVVPEGFNHVQLATRLQELGVCEAEGFEQAVRDEAAVRRLGVPAPTAEGYLFPATYELLSDSTPSAVVAVLVAEAQKHFGALHAAHAAEFDARQREHGLSAHDVVTLASIIEREAAKADEKPLIASVFLNRLIDPSFRPLHMLQSDPTAAYGCLVQAPPPVSCTPGKPTPAMLRDSQNLYNTYRHPGLPPGPISSPGEAAITAVLQPASTDYLYFVAAGGGRHHFSRTFTEHRGAIEQTP